jgi:hypothetical protein
MDYAVVWQHTMSSLQREVLSKSLSFLYVIVRKYTVLISIELTHSGVYAVCSAG